MQDLRIFNLKDLNILGEREYKTVEPPRIYSNRVFPDTVKHSLYIPLKLSEIKSLPAIEFNFKTGTKYEWCLKVITESCITKDFSYGLLICGLQLQNCSKPYPYVTIITPFEYYNILSATYLPKETRGFIYSDAGLSNIFPAYICIIVLEKLVSNYNESIITNVKEINNKKIDSSDFSEALFSEDGDVTLFGSDWQYRCHKKVLTSRSPVFKAMFEHDIAGNEISRVEIPDIAAPVVRSMLLFMYTGQAAGLSKFIDKLVYAANKYQVEDLKSACAIYMAKNISVDNAAEFLSLSDLFNSKPLVSTIIQFVHSNLDAVLLTNGWMKLERSKKCLCELIKYQESISNVKTEDEEN